MITTKQLRCLQLAAGVEKLGGDPELGDAIRAALVTIKEQEDELALLHRCACGDASMMPRAQRAYRTWIVKYGSEP